MMTLVLVWASFGLSWNLLSGYTGLVSFGHAAFFGIGAYTDGARADPLRSVALDPDPDRGRARRHRRAPASAFPTFRLRGVYFALSMLAYPLALLYVFEWLGYQEVTLPMKRDNAGRLHAVQRSPHLHAAGARDVGR